MKSTASTVAASPSSSSSFSKFNFVKRVLSRKQAAAAAANNNSSISPSSLVLSSTSAPAVMKGDDNNDTGGGDTRFHSELQVLKEQIDSLQASVSRMHADSEAQERAFASLAAEKERLVMDLKRQRRATSGLKQQLEDERKFYYKEKELYCQEMHSVRKMKRASTEVAATVAGESEEVLELKRTLNQTLAANYNLSVKFLRMKNTKSSVRKQLSRLRQRHDAAAAYYCAKVEALQRQTDSLLAEHLHAPIPPSSKKYLHLLKQNGAVIHENLELHSTVDRLHYEIDQLRMLQLKHETNSKLKLIHHETTQSQPQPPPPQPPPELCANCKVSKESIVATTNTTTATTTTSGITVRSRSSQTPTARHHQHPSTRRSRHHHAQLPLPAAATGVDNEPRDSKYDLMTVSSENIHAEYTNHHHRQYHHHQKRADRILQRHSAPEMIATNASLNV